MLPWCKNFWTKSRRHASFFFLFGHWHLPMAIFFLMGKQKALLFFFPFFGSMTFPKMNLIHRNFSSNFWPPFKAFKKTLYKVKYKKKQAISIATYFHIFFAYLFPFKDKVPPGWHLSSQFSSLPFASLVDHFRRC